MAMNALLDSQRTIQGNSVSASVGAAMNIEIGW
jgi:hypothetical protein